MLGRNSTSVTFAADDLTLGRVVVLQILARELAGDASWVRRGEHDVPLAAHPRVLAILELGTLETGEPYLVTERCLGHSLAQRLESWRVLSLREALDILEQIADGLEHLHRAGIVHRALEPANVLVLEGAPLGVKLIGLDRALLDASTYARMARDGAWLVEPRFLAPELVRGELPTPATDVYALGCIAYEMLAGRPPFVGTASEILAAKRLRHPPRLDQIGAATTDVASVVARAMSPRATDRPSAAGFVRALRSAAPEASQRFDGGAITLPMNATLVGGTLGLALLIGVVVLVLTLALR